MSPKNQSLMAKALDINKLFPPEEVYRKEESFGKKILYVAWAVEILASLVGLTVAWLMATSAYTSFDGEKNFETLINAILGGLPFLIIAIIEPTKIPLAGGLYKVRSFGWRVLILMSLLGLTAVTFETMFTGLERQFSNVTKIVTKETNKIQNTMQRIATLEHEVTEIEAISEDAATAELLKSQNGLMVRRDEEIKSIEDNYEKVFDPWNERKLSLFKQRTEIIELRTDPNRASWEQKQKQIQEYRDEQKEIRDRVKADVEQYRTDSDNEYEKAKINLESQIQNAVNRLKSLEERKKDRQTEIVTIRGSNSNEPKSVVEKRIAIKEEEQTVANDIDKLNKLAINEEDRAKNELAEDERRLEDQRELRLSQVKTGILNIGQLAINEEVTIKNELADDKRRLEDQRELRLSQVKPGFFNSGQSEKEKINEEINQEIDKVSTAADKKIKSIRTRKDNEESNIQSEIDKINEEINEELNAASAVADKKIKAIRIRKDNEESNIQITSQNKILVIKTEIDQILSTSKSITNDTVSQTESDIKSINLEIKQVTSKINDLEDRLLSVGSGIDQDRIESMYGRADLEIAGLAEIIDNLKQEIKNGQDVASGVNENKIKSIDVEIKNIDEQLKELQISFNTNLDKSKQSYADLIAADELKITKIKSDISDRRDRLPTLLQQVINLEQELDEARELKREKSEDNQIYRLAAWWYGVDDVTKVDRSQLSKVSTVWFGSIAFTIATTGTVLALISYILRDPQAFVERKSLKLGQRIFRLSKLSLGYFNRLLKNLSRVFLAMAKLLLSVAEVFRGSIGMPTQRAIRLSLVAVRKKLNKPRIVTEIKEVEVEKVVEVEKEVIKEVEVEKVVEVEKEVIKEVEVEKEVIKEVPVEKVVLKEVPVEIVRKELVYVPLYSVDAGVVEAIDTATNYSKDDIKSVKKPK